MTDRPIDLELGRKVLTTEAAAILELVDRLDDRFRQAIELLMGCTGRVIVTGMGKSGIVCRKIAATLSSTGTPAFFLHPAEALHGDLGAVQGTDVVVALSYGGETDELIRLLEAVRRLGAGLIAITGVPSSTLGLAADVTLDCHVSEEACPMNLAPTASTTAALALGDALAMTLLVAKGFRQEDFANRHPGGTLGKRLMRVDQLMRTGDDMPRVTPASQLADVVHEITQKAIGMTCVVDADNRLLGVITDGDLRRHMGTLPNLLGQQAADVMTATPITLARDTLAVEALRTLEERRITSVVVVEPDQMIAGVVHLHDLWRTQMF